MLRNFITKSIRSAAILTNSYVAATVVDRLNEYNQCVLCITWTKGSLTSLEIKLEYSLDGTTYFQQTNAAVSGGTTTLTKNEYTHTEATANLQVEVPISANFLKVSAKGTGTVTSSSLTLDVMLMEV